MTSPDTTRTPKKARARARSTAQSVPGFAGFDAVSPSRAHAREAPHRSPKVSKGSRGFHRARTGADWAPLFLAELAVSGLVSPAARAAGIGRRTAYDRRERDEDFAVRWYTALDAARSARIVKRHRRHPAIAAPPDELAARVRAVQYALRRYGLGSLADELAEIARHLEGHARREREAREARLEAAAREAAQQQGER